MPHRSGPLPVPCDIHRVFSAPSLGLCLPDLAARVRGRRVVLCTERRLAGPLRSFIAALARAADGADLVTFQGGERNKNRRTKALLEDRLLARGAAKDCLLVALGGGVVTDLVGFTAATYLRGVPYVSVPTTLLAMVDAALGGKTGVNTPRGKNLVGAHHPPEAVYLALDTLATLPRREFAAGLAECLKHGLIEDRRLFRELCGRTPAQVKAAPADLESLVRTSAAVKCRVASEDPREATGRRNVLNAGHTVAHALESLSGFRMGHGEAVAAGLCWEAAVAVHQGLDQARIKTEITIE